MSVRTAMGRMVSLQPGDAEWAMSKVIGRWRVFAVSIAGWWEALRDGQMLGCYFGADDIAEMQRIPREKRRLEWGAGRIAAKLALRQLHRDQDGGVAALNTIEIGNRKAGPHRGQPQSNCARHLSISHAGEWAVAVAGRSHVGVDVERIRSFGSAMRDMVLTAREREWIDAAEARETDLRTTLVWSFKESFMKAHGLGVFGHFRDIELTGMAANGRLAWSLSGSLESTLRRLATGTFEAIGERIGDYTLVVSGASDRGP